MSSLDSANIAAFCSKIDLTKDRPCVDLSNVTFIKPFALVYLGMFLRYFNSKGKSFYWTRPTAPGVRKYLADMRFYERFNFDPEFISKEKLLRYPRGTSLNDILDIERAEDVGEHVAQMALAVVRSSGCNVRAGIGMVAEVASELADNFGQHAGATLAAFTAQWFPNLKHLSLAFGDCGFGIRETLQRNPDYSYLADRSDCEAITLAFEPLVSCRGEGGTVLTEVRDVVLSSGASLVIASGSGRVIIDSRGKQYSRPMEFRLPGVQLVMSFPAD